MLSEQECNNWNFRGHRYKQNEYVQLTGKSGTSFYEALESVNL